MIRLVLLTTCSKDIAAGLRDIIDACPGDTIFGEFI